MRKLLLFGLVIGACAQGPSIHARDPYRAIQVMAERHSATAADLPRLVELLDHTRPQMTGSCGDLERDQAAIMASNAAGIVNSFGANMAECRKHAWPSTAGHARQILRGWPDQAAVADVILARAFAPKPPMGDPRAYYALDHLTGLGGAALATKIVAMLPRVDADKREILLRLALDVDGGDPEAVRDIPGARAAAVALRWGAIGATRARAIATLSRTIDRWQTLDALARIGERAAPVLTRASRERMWRIATASRSAMGSVVELIQGARVLVEPHERRMMAQIYDRHCEEPDRKTEREMGEWFVMWRASWPECDRVHGWLGLD